MMPSASKSIAISSSTALFLIVIVLPSSIFLSPVVVAAAAASSNSTADPTPTPWPHQFHSILFMNYTGSLQLIDLWYDWPKGRNFNIIQDQLGKLLYDLEWNNGTSFFYTLDSSKECRTAQLEVGILRPNWLDGANYLGQQHVDGFLCNVWEKVDFIWYYEDVVTKRPVHWLFYTGRAAHVMTFEVGAVLEDEKWQAPAYCFENAPSPKAKHDSVIGFQERLMDGVLTGSMSLPM
ncbi:hypothetical protein F0562_034426 [Nyssa sinensis]|uniref:Uncharacterized protein n=1 Tax=Nyssa sinensis TaxID=561372 RepID=A0A5J5AHA3_9ASTE|nr:hypothetical protein F0562_034426 [Nyssa sinensis]